MAPTHHKKQSRIHLHRPEHGVTWPISQERRVNHVLKQGTPESRDMDELDKYFNIGSEEISVMRGRLPSMFSEEAEVMPQLGWSRSCQTRSEGSEFSGGISLSRNDRGSKRIFRWSVAGGSR